MEEIPLIPFAFAISFNCATVDLLKSCVGVAFFAGAFLAVGAFGVAVLVTFTVLVLMAAGFDLLLAKRAIDNYGQVLLLVWPVPL